MDNDDSTQTCFVNLKYFINLKIIKNNHNPVKLKPENDLKDI